MSISTQPNGKIVVRTALTFDPVRDQALVRILQDAERSGASLAAVIVDLMRTGLPAHDVDVETEESELVDLSQLAYFMDSDE